MILRAGAPLQYSTTAKQYCCNTVSRSPLQDRIHCITLYTARHNTVLSHSQGKDALGNACRQKRHLVVCCVQYEEIAEEEVAEF